MEQGDIMDSKSLSAVNCKSVTIEPGSANECFTPLQGDTMEAAQALGITEAAVWNRRKRTDDVISPAEKTRGLIEEVLWWHKVTGNAVTFDEVMSRNRSIYIMAVRADCMRRIRDVRKWSYPRIAKYFGGMDHTTVLHHCTKKSVATRAFDFDKSRRHQSHEIWASKKYAKWLDKPHALGGESSTTNGASNGMG